MYIFRTITNKIRLLGLMMGAAVLGGCSQDAFEAPIVPVESNGGQISVLYEVEGDIPLTRGIAALEHEKALEHVYILYFDHSDSDKYAGCTRAQASSGSSTVKFDPPEDLPDNTQYRLLVVGNSDRYAGAGNSSFSSMLGSFTSEDDYISVRGKLAAMSDESVTEPDNLPLTGRFVNPSTDDELYFNFSRTPEGIKFPDGEGKSIFRFQRAICRVDIHNLVADILDIRYVRLVNTRDMGSYFFDGMNQGNYHDLKFEKDAKSPGFIALPEKGDEEKLQRLEAKLYCFPNTVNTCLPNDQKTTAAMIAGYYTDPETGVKDTEMTYYRFNISNAGDAQTLQRNYCYRATIKGVKRRGKTDELEAFNETSPIFMYDIGEEWNTDDDNVVTDEHGNFLVVSKSLLTFSGDQSGADVVKLTVNTSEGMDWDIQMDDESAKHFQARKIEGAPGEKIQAFTCGPKQTNHTDYYYEGSLMIVAKNKISGSELRKEVRLVQLTTSGDVKCLVVNDYTSSFAQEVSKYGQTISYKVITGNPTNRWTARDIDGTMETWLDNISYTTSGTNGNYFTITFPANISGKRSVDIKFEFDCGDPVANEQVKPITVTFTQDVCSQPLTIEGWPTDGELTLNCFDTHTGWEYANCVAQSMMFTVHLQRPDEHYFTVTSSFDECRDLTLSSENHKPGTVHPLTSLHPGLLYRTLDFTGGQDAANSYYNNALDGRNLKNSTFWINAFRMGPGDPKIQRTITVEVKDKTTGELIPEGTMSITVNLVVPSDQFMLNDVMIKNSYRAGDEDPKDNGWIYIMDRNIGCVPRCHKDQSGNIFENRAMWCHIKEDSYWKTENWKISNTQEGYIDNENYIKWAGTLEFPYGSDHSSSFDVKHHLPAWINELKETHKHLGKNYENAENYPWNIFSSYTTPSIRNSMAISKGRYFILADEEVCPKNNKGELIRVACWLPSGIECGYGFITGNGKFEDQLVMTFPASKLTSDHFWKSSYGYIKINDVKIYTHLIRLMYLIGSDNAEYYVSSLPKDQIQSEIDYYKNHILQCYGTVKFE